VLDTSLKVGVCVGEAAGRRRRIDFVFFPREPPPSHSPPPRDSEKVRLHVKAARIISRRLTSRSSPAIARWRAASASLIMQPMIAQAPIINNNRRHTLSLSLSLSLFLSFSLCLSVSRAAIFRSGAHLDKCDLARCRFSEWPHPETCVDGLRRLVR